MTKTFLPPYKPANAAGTFEPDGLCIWLNESNQSAIPGRVDVLAHEYTHYLQTISTLYGTSDLLSLIGEIHASIQRLEELGMDIQLPLRKWAKAADCPPLVKGIVATAEQRIKRRAASHAVISDILRQDVASTHSLFYRDGQWYTPVHPPNRVPVEVAITPIVLLEGMAIAVESQVRGSIDSIEEMYRAGDWKYVATYEACRSAHASVDPLFSSKLLCDTALCSPNPAATFAEGVSRLRSLPPNATTDDMISLARTLFSQHCEADMTAISGQLQKAIDILPEDHKSGPSWAFVALRSALTAVRMRQGDSTQLARAVNLSISEIATQVGSPVVLTNDRRLTLLYEEPLKAVHLAIFSVRSISMLCRLIVFGGRAACPYAGCPGCPSERAGAACDTDVRRVIALGDQLPWCALYAAAAQLRVRYILTRSLLLT
ncbi:MAG: hypothetical protein QM820_23685 [Minicystis sp.]